MMIKKEYIAPSMEVVEMEVTHMLADSIRNGEETGGNWEELPDEELSNRRRNFWEEVGSGW